MTSNRSTQYALILFLYNFVVSLTFLQFLCMLKSIYEYTVELICTEFHYLFIWLNLPYANDQTSINVVIAG